MNSASLLPWHASGAPAEQVSKGLLLDLEPTVTNAGMRGEAILMVGFILFSIFSKSTKRAEKPGWAAAGHVPMVTRYSA